MPGSPGKEPGNEVSLESARGDGRGDQRDRDFDVDKAASQIALECEPKCADRFLRRALGQTQTLCLDASRDQHIAHAYADTAFAAQGRTADHVIIHADSRATNLVDQKSFYVGISRARQSATVFTNDRAKLISAINERAGTVQTAITHAAISAPVANNSAASALPKTLSSLSGMGL